jgi:acyl carrier protein
MSTAVVTQVIKAQLSLDDIDLSKPLSDYNGDSLDVVEIVMAIESELGIEISDDDFFEKGNGVTGADLVAMADAGVPAIAK